MKYYTKQFAFALAILLISATTFAQTQNAPGNPLPTTSKFNDIVEVNFIGVTNDGSGITMAFKNVFAFKLSEKVSLGPAVGLQSGDNYSFAVPLSFDFRYYFNTNKVPAPFLNFYTGYAFNTGYRFLSNNEFFLGGNVGLNIILLQQISLQLALGVRVDAYGNSNFLGDLKINNRGSSQGYLSVPFTIGVVF